MFASINRLALISSFIAATVASSVGQEKDNTEIPTGPLSGAMWREDTENQQYYWVIKDAIREAGEEWNRTRADESPRLLVPSGFVADLRRNYVATLDKLWPTLTEEHAYTRAEVAKIKQRLTDRSALGAAVRSYLDDIALAGAQPHSNDEEQAQRTIFERMNQPPIGIRHGPNAITVPWSRHLGRAILLLEPHRCTLHLNGPQLDEKFELDGASYAIPLNEGKYVADATASGRTSAKTEFQITRGRDTEVKISLPIIATSSDAQAEKSKPQSNCYREDEGRQVDVLLAAYEQTLGSSSVLRYDFRRFYAPWREGRIRLGKLDLPFAEFRDHWSQRYPDFPAIDLLIPRRTRGEFNDGSGQRPNAAFHDPCFNVRIDYTGLERDPLHASIDRAAFEADVATAIVEWANARRADAPEEFDPLSCFSVNGRFYCKAHLRMFAEGKVNPLTSPFVRLGDGNRGVVVNNYLHWDRAHYDKVCARFPLVWKSSDGQEMTFAAFRPSDERVDLTISFTNKPRIQADAPNVVATTEVNRDIELHTNVKSHGGRAGRWVFVPQQAWASYRPPEGLPFDVQPVRFGCIILHEFGHYFGTPHLPEVNNSDLAACSMWWTSAAKTAALTIPDVLAFNRVVYLGKARLGTLCEGLEFNPESVKE
jgi:hypothetical protein